MMDDATCQQTARDDSSFLERKYGCCLLKRKVVAKRKVESVKSLLALKRIVEEKDEFISQLRKGNDELREQIDEVQAQMSKFIEYYISRKAVTH